MFNRFCPFNDTLLLKLNPRCFHDSVFFLHPFYWKRGEENMFGFPHRMLVQLRSRQPTFSKAMRGFRTASLIQNRVALFRVHDISNLFWRLQGLLLAVLRAWGRCSHLAGDARATLVSILWQMRGFYGAHFSPLLFWGIKRRYCNF